MGPTRLYVETQQYSPGACWNTATLPRVCLVLSYLGNGFQKNQKGALLRTRRSFWIVFDPVRQIWQIGTSPSLSGLIIFGEWFKNHKKQSYGHDAPFWWLLDPVPQMSVNGDRLGDVLMILTNLLELNKTSSRLLKHSNASPSLSGSVIFEELFKNL